VTIDPDNTDLCRGIPIYDWENDFMNSFRRYAMSFWVKMVDDRAVQE